MCGVSGVESPICRSPDGRLAPRPPRRSFATGPLNLATAVVMLRWLLLFVKGGQGSWQSAKLLLVRSYKILSPFEIEFTTCVHGLRRKGCIVKSLSI